MIASLRILRYHMRRRVNALRLTSLLKQFPDSLIDLDFLLA
jgi:hypothetical protein